MSDVVAIPAANRPELLALTLEKLGQVGDRPEVHIYADSVPESRLREMEIVRDLYLPEAFLFSARPHVKAHSGCWNILNAIKDAAKWADTVYLVEEDVLIYPDFFSWHRSQTAAVSCGRTLPKFPWYTNPGSCLRRPLLDKLVPHICDEYFQNTVEYCRRFPPAEWTSTLDDGLIRRVIADAGLDWVSPVKPVCAHAGFYWLGRLDIYSIDKSWPLDLRIERVREIIANPVNRERYAQDWEPYAP